MSDDFTPTGEGRQLLAAEYVLGVLDAAQRGDAKRLLAQDPAFAAEVTFWEERLGGLTSEVLPVTPARAGLEPDQYGVGSRSPSRRSLEQPVVLALVGFCFRGPRRGLAGRRLFRSRFVSARSASGDAGCQRPNRLCRSHRPGP